MKSLNILLLSMFLAIPAADLWARRGLGGGGMRVSRPASGGSVRYGGRAPSRPATRPSTPRTPPPRAASRPVTPPSSAVRPSQPIRRTPGAGGIPTPRPLPAPGPIAGRPGQLPVAPAAQDPLRPRDGVIQRPDHLPERPAHLPDRPLRPDRPIRPDLPPIYDRWPWYGGWVYWWGGYWWWPTYHDTEVIYVQGEAPVDLEITKEPENCQPAEGHPDLCFDGATYYRKVTKDGKTYWVVAEKPQSEANDATALLRRTADFLAAQPQLQVTLKETTDHVQANGQKLSLSSDRRLWVKRPGALVSEVKGTGTDRLFVYDGKKASLLDRSKNVWMKVDAPADIDSAITAVTDRFSVTVPAADLMRNNLSGFLQERVSEAAYVGRNPLEGKDCHHLTLKNEAVNVELWIDAAELPLPRKMVIRYTGLPGSPSYAASFSNWIFDKEIPADRFAFSPPAGAEEMRLAPSASEARRRVAEARKALEDFKEKNKHIEDYRSASKNLKMWQAAAGRPDVDQIIRQEKEKIEKAGKISDSDLQAYDKELQRLKQEFEQAQRDLAASGGG